LADLRTRSVRFGPKAQVRAFNIDVRFTPESGHSPARPACPLWAKRRLSAAQQNGSHRNLQQCFDSDATVFDALAKMAEKNVGSLVVMDGEKLIGIITERHYSRNVILKGKTSPSTLVRDIMERNVVHVRPEQSVDLCMALMTEKRVRHLPVVQDSSVIGIVSIGDLLKFIISKKEFDIDQLEHYIQGGRAA
jgi:predicted transcriptional regulator